MKAPVRVTVTGAAGQIGYALLFRIASGSMLGDDQPVIQLHFDATQSLHGRGCLLYTSPSPRDMRRSRMPSSA